MKSLYFIILFLCTTQACQKWPYLQPSAFKNARQERVAHMVDGCDTIIEIGGAGAPISGFVPKDKKVIVIDPKIKRKEQDNITHVPKPFEKWHEMPTSKNYAVVILGLQLQMPDGAWKKLHSLIEGSAVTVIEYAAQNKEAKKQFRDIQESVSKVWDEPQEIEITGYELEQFKGHVFNHRVLHRTKEKPENIE